LTQPVFPDTYAEGRGRFVELVSACKGTHQAHQHPLEGPEGERLYTDVATWGSREASTAVALIAGTHGIEGFAGSGIMATLLSEELPGKMPGDVKLVMIHALNPFGFAWERRVNENNVDLNRNFVDHDSAYPANPLYAELAELVTPRTWEETTLEDIAEHSKRSTASIRLKFSARGSTRIPTVSFSAAMPARGPTNC
jgi:predicted deacylase